MTTPTTVSVRLQLRADTAANWTSANPTLLANELGRETDTGKIKIGDGSTAWSSLAYQAWATLPIAVASGGTGQTSYTNGQLLIGNTTGNTLTKATLTAGSGIAITNGTGSITVAASGISDAQIAADAEIAVSKLADGTARQLLQTDAAGTGVEWASNIDIPGTLDVTSAATFDSTIGASAGTASLPSITFTGDLNTGIYSPGADQVAISTGGSGRLFVDASGRVGVGISNPSSTYLHVYTTAPGTASAPTICLEGGANGYGAGIDFASRTSAGGTLVSMAKITADGEAAWNTTASTQDANLRFFTAADGSLFERLRVTSAGLVGVGTTSPGTTLDVNGGFQVTGSVTGYSAGEVRLGGTGSNIDSAISTQASGSPILFFDHRATSNTGIFAWRNGTGAGSERMRLDGSGRLLVGTSSSVPVLSSLTGAAVQVNSNNHGAYAQTWFYGANNQSGAAIMLAKSRNTTYGSYTAVQSGDSLGGLYWAGDDGSDLNNQAASILCWVDGTPGTDDMPGRLVFSTTADGASSPTERMRITSGGAVLVGTTDTTVFDNTSGAGIVLDPVGAVQIARSGEAGLFVNRMTNDGVLVAFYQAGTFEGDISVSGTTVSYNGAHLSRWSQLPSGAERTEILRGSVLSNIDEMCEWGEEENEQLNRMKVSDVEGDKNVSGVFQAWDDDDDTYTNDFYCAMTGDFIIRIAEGVTVERGDLLMSAGDGTAKPQDDDIIRSKTIAKVTSTNVSCTYEDGSYCVPCVLMAC